MPLPLSLCPLRSRPQFFWLDVRPVVDCTVVVQRDPGTLGEPPCVAIRCLRARVEGKWAEENDLNARFEFSGTTRLEWGGREGAVLGASAIVSVNGAPRGTEGGSEGATPPEGAALQMLCAHFACAVRTSALALHTLYHQHTWLTPGGYPSADIVARVDPPDPFAQIPVGAGGKESETNQNISPFRPGKPPCRRCPRCPPSALRTTLLGSVAAGLWSALHPSTAPLVLEPTYGGNTGGSQSLSASCIPPPPSAGVLEGVGNAVVAAVAAKLQEVFVGALAADYAKWATDEASREARRRRIYVRRRPHARPLVATGHQAPPKRLLLQGRLQPVSLLLPFSHRRLFCLTRTRGVRTGEATAGGRETNCCADMIDDTRS